MARDSFPRLLLIVGLVAIALLSGMLGVGPGSAQTATAGPGFVVNDLGDAPDANVGNNVCLTAGSKCTLRAALQEANANADSNTITFSVTGTITPATALPDLSSGSITIAGANQQVTIDGSGLPGGTPCLNLASDGNVVKGLVIAECAGDGIELGGGGNTIGGTSASDRNVIRNGAQMGVGGCGSAGASAVTGNQILGNYIGVSKTGNQAAPNSYGGVFLCYGASGNAIGGSSAGARNVIGGHWNAGVRLMGAGPDNVVQGNYLGVDATGSFAIGNGTGVQMDEGASGNSVLDNVISGNLRTGVSAGVSIGGLSYSVSGSQTDIFASMNLHGVLKVQPYAQGAWETEQVNGTAPSWTFLASKADTLEITVSALDDGCGSVGPIWLHHFGTGEKVQITPGVAHTCPGAGETVFFWSQPIGIPTAPFGPGTGNVIQSNKIGTNPAGSAAIPNGTGILVMGNSSSAVIGGSSSAVGNLISGNWNAAIEASRSEGTIIQGNLIGTDAGGNYAISNGGLGGTVVTGEHTVIGGTTPGERNVISGNYAGAINVGPDPGSGGGNATITGNYIGTNAAGNSGIPNGAGIVMLSGGNVVGGADPDSRNLIAGNNGAGLFIMWGGSNNSVVQGNTIIYNKSGVVITEGASHNTIEGNWISANWNGPGVSIGGLWYMLTGSENVFSSIQLDGTLSVLVNGEDFDEYDADGGEISFQSLVANPGDEIELQLLAGSDGCGSVGPLWLHHFQTGEKVQLTDGIAEGCPGEDEEVDSITYDIEFPADEIETTGNVVRGNKIGTDSSGTTAMGNGKDGVRIIGNSAENVIGGDAPGEGNVISGNNGSGVHVYGGSQNDVIQGNYIGVDESGTAPLPNGGHGIELGTLQGYSDAEGTIIGGTEPAARNVISGNGGAGINLWFSTSGASVRGNYIGTNAAGDAAVGNGNEGIVMFLSAHDNVIGGDSAAERNIISGNAWGGVRIYWGADNNVVEGNYIGLSADGGTAIPNSWPGGRAGVDINDGADENEVRGNVISGNNGDGVAVGENTYSLAGADDDFFVEIDLDDHIVVTRNGSSVFSGDAQDGSIGNIWLRGNPGDQLVITVTSSDGCPSVGPIWLHHLATGHVQVTDGEDNGCTGQPIIINYTIPIPVNYAASWNVIEDNLIGTNPAGDAPMPNEGAGISLRGSSRDTIIGSPGHGNVISGNRYNGIVVGGLSENDVIQGNHIGVNAAGNAPLPNGHNGIYFAESGAGVGTLIGGSAPGQGNVIAANGFNGVDLKNGAHNVVVQGNFIGTDTSGTLQLGNGHNGVIAHEGAHDNLMGGTAAGEANVIAHNHYSGVGVNGASSIGNTIRGNSIHSNSGIGIGLEEGGNTELPAPVITSLGPVMGTACPNCVVDVYSDTENEGRIWHGSTVANGSGNFTYSGGVSGPSVTATATDADGNTSRFSNPVRLLGVALIRIDSAALPPGGITTTVGLRAFDVPPPGLGAFTIDISYDPDVVTPTGCNPDPDAHFDAPFCNTGFGPGTIRVGGFRTSDGAVGDLLLANITFQAVAPSCSWSPLTLTVDEFESTVPNPIPAATESGGLGVGLQGDANRSGQVTMVDAMMIAQVVVGLRPAADIDPVMSDVNCDGKTSMVDAMLVAQHVVFGKEFTCWVCE